MQDTTFYSHIRRVQSDANERIYWTLENTVGYINKTLGDIRGDLCTCAIHDKNSITYKLTEYIDLDRYRILQNSGQKEIIACTISKALFGGTFGDKIFSCNALHKDFDRPIHILMPWEYDYSSSGQFKEPYDIEISWNVKVKEPISLIDNTNIIIQRHDGGLVEHFTSLYRLSTKYKEHAGTDTKIDTKSAVRNISKAILTNISNHAYNGEGYYIQKISLPEDILFSIYEIGKKPEEYIVETIHEIIGKEFKVIMVGYGENLTYLIHISW